MRLPSIGLMVAALSISPTLAQQATTLDGLTSEVTALAFYLDGKRLIATSLKDDRVWDPATGKSAGKITGARSHAVAVSPDGKRVAIAGFDEIAIHDPDTGNRLSGIDPHGDWDRGFPFRPTISSMTFSPDSRLLATAGSVTKVGGRHGYPGGVVKIWDVAAGKEVRSFGMLSHRAEAVVFSPDGKLLAAGTNGAGGELPEPGEVRLWEIAGGELLLTLKVKERIIAGKNRCSASDVAFSPDGKTLVAASSDGNVRLWDLPAGRLSRTFSSNQRGVRRVAYSPDGKLLALVGNDRSVGVWNVATGEQIRSLPFDTPKINAVSFSPDGRLLAAGGGDFLRSGEVKVWALNEQ